MKSKTFTIILAFILGIFGLHRLYLRQYLKALLYLIYPITLLTAAFYFTGFLEVLRDEPQGEILKTLIQFFPLFMIIPVIDGIWFLLMSKDKFDRLYNSNKKHATREVYYSVGILLLGFLYNYAFFQLVYAKSDINTGQKADVSITSEELASAFSEDEEGASAKYSGKVIEVSGPIESEETQLAQNGEEKVLILTGDGALSIRCEFEPGEQAKISDLKPGDHVKVKGRFREVMIFDVVLDHCILEE